MADEDRDPDWRHPNCGEKHTPCRWPYCFDWHYTEAELAVTRRLTDG